MNKGYVRSARAAHLHCQTLRRRGAGIARDALWDALDSSAMASLLMPSYFAISLAVDRATTAWYRRHDQLVARRIAFHATRLARANGWGSAGQCPASYGAKTPAVRARVCRDAAAASGAIKGAHRVVRASRRNRGRDVSACVSARQPMVGVSNGA